MAKWSNARYNHSRQAAFKGAISCCSQTCVVQVALLDGLLQSAARQAHQTASADAAQEQSPPSAGKGRAADAASDPEGVQVATVDSFQV